MYADHRAFCAFLLLNRFFFCGDVMKQVVAFYLNVYLSLHLLYLSLHLLYLSLHKCICIIFCNCILSGLGENSKM